MKTRPFRRGFLRGLSPVLLVLAAVGVARAGAVNATGTVEPEEVIDVGAEVQGRILKLGADPADPKMTIDFNTSVEEGTVLAEIDPTIYRAHAQGAKAALKAAEANLKLAEAKKRRADRDYDRLKSASAKGAVAQSDLDQAEAEAESADAVLAGAAAAVEQAKAGLEEAQIELDGCTIKSPVKGVVIDRRVNVGQTVVASLSAPSLFLIAKDLTHMQVWASVNEADVGAVHVGQDATFTVDARPGKEFHGKVAQVRLNATTTQNVVTYTVVINAENKATGAGPVDRELLPYLTAHVSIRVGEKERK